MRYETQKIEAIRPAYGKHLSAAGINTTGGLGNAGDDYALMFLRPRPVVSGFKPHL